MRLVLLLCLLVALVPSRLHAHENTPGVLAVKELSPGRFALTWTAPAPAIDDLRVAFPDPCRVNGERTIDPALALRLTAALDCGTRGLAGEVVFQSTLSPHPRVAVNVEWLDGGQTFLLSDGTPASVALTDRAGSRSALAVARSYLGLGVEHIWLGADHLLFLLGLLLLIRNLRSLLATITAFTLAHSITLALASLDFVRVPTGPVEICIALSVLLLAVEATTKTATVSRRWPWLVAFGFGLLHGLGFASALDEVGLPRGAILPSLLGFNLGVELGQIAVVAAVALAHRQLRHRPVLLQRVERGAAWTLGVCAVYWLLARSEGWLVELLS